MQTVSPMGDVTKHGTCADSVAAFSMEANTTFVPFRDKKTLTRAERCVPVAASTAGIGQATGVGACTLRKEASMW